MKEERRKERAIKRERRDNEIMELEAEKEIDRIVLEIAKRDKVYSTLSPVLQDVWRSQRKKKLLDRKKARDADQDLPGFIL
tara:strand:- start:377 stop:619 length:243 start_codon:yes stop_codon:yes gene_type:complete